MSGRGGVRVCVCVSMCVHVGFCAELPSRYHISPPLTFFLVIPSCCCIHPKTSLRPLVRTVRSETRRTVPGNAVRQRETHVPWQVARRGWMDVRGRGSDREFNVEIGIYVRGKDSEEILLQSTYIRRMECIYHPFPFHLFLTYFEKTIWFILISISISKPSTRKSELKFFSGHGILLLLFIFRINICYLKNTIPTYTRGGGGRNVPAGVEKLFH